MKTKPSKEERLAAAKERFDAAEKAYKKAQEGLEHAERDKAGLADELMAKAYVKYGPPFQIDYFGDQWRVWWTSWHVHSRKNPAVSLSDLSAYGRYLYQALERVLEMTETAHVFKGPCERGCVGYCAD